MITYDKINEKTENIISTAGGINEIINFKNSNNNKVDSIKNDDMNPNYQNKSGENINNIENISEDKNSKEEYKTNEQQESTEFTSKILNEVENIITVKDYLSQKYNKYKNKEFIPLSLEYILNKNKSFDDLDVSYVRFIRKKNRI